MKTQIGHVALLAMLGLAAVPAVSVVAQSKAPEVNACSLLKEDEIAKVIGLPVGAGVRKDVGYTNDSSYSSVCLWRVKGDEGANNPGLPMGGARFAILNVQSFPKGQAGKFVENFRQAAKNGDIDKPPVDLKIADEAVWWGDGVAVRKGDISFGVSVHVPAERTKHRERAEILARQIASKL